MPTPATTTGLCPPHRAARDGTSGGELRKLMRVRHGVASRVLVWAAAMLIGAAVAVVAAEKAVPEPELKAVFLFKLAQFVEWPEGTWLTGEAPLVIGVVGEDPIAAALAKTVRNETVRGRPISVKPFGRDERPSGCQIVFVTRAAKDGIKDVLTALKGQPVLTVSDNEGFCRHGGMVTFVVRDSVRFQINPGEANKAGVRISSQLLKLAEIVRTGD